MKQLPTRPSAAVTTASVLAAASFGAALLLSTPLLSGPAEAQSCATIGSSTFCGARGSHNTVGNTVIFNNGPAGRRIGNYTVTGTPPRSEMLRSARQSPLSAPRTYAGVAAPKKFVGTGPYYDSRIAALRAEILAIEAQYQLQQLKLTPAQKAAQDTMPPALVRALALAKQAREKEAAEAGAAPPAAQ